MGRVQQQGKSQAEVEQWLQQAAARLQVPNLQVWFANNTLAAEGGRGGVAIVLLSPEVLAEPVLIKIERATPDGRMIVCSLQWAGHQFVILNTYWPNTHREREDFLTHTLVPTLAGVHKDRLILTGDFNHVEDADLDRTRLAADGAIRNAGRAQEEALAKDLAAAMQASGQDMVDVYRVLHRHTRCYTRFQGSVGSRIDRFYAPATLQPHIMQSDTCYHVTGSDHLPVRLVVAPKRLNGLGGRRSWRANIAFMQEEGRQRALAAWAATMVRNGLAKTPRELLQWWPTLKCDCKQQIKAHMAGFAAQVRGQPTERAAEQELQAALEEVWEAGEGAQPEQFQRVQEARAQAAEVVHASAAFAAAKERADWLHHREAPSPALTRMMQPPKMGMRMTALRLEEGGMVTDPQELAEQVAQHFAGVSRQRAVTAEAQQQILERERESLHRVRQGKAAMALRMAKWGRRHEPSRVLRRALQHHGAPAEGKQTECVKEVRHRSHMCKKEGRKEGVRKQAERNKRKAQQEARAPEGSRRPQATPQRTQQLPTPAPHTAPPHNPTQFGPPPWRLPQ